MGGSLRIQWFQGRVAACGLLDLGFQGPKFTWRGPKNVGCARLFERLDRALATNDFFLTFENYSVKVLPRTKFSYHNPLVLNLGVDSCTRGERPFRFEAMWLEHEIFKDLLLQNWGEVNELDNSLANMGMNLLDWNRNIFGFVEKEKRVILARLGSIQASPAYTHSAFLNKLERKLHLELEEILKLEEIKWFQRARTTWVTKDECNTRYYHLKTNIRGRRNRVLALKDNEGNWVEGDTALKQLVLTFFRKLYNLEVTNKKDLITASSFPSLVEGRLTNLCAQPSDLEIKNALFSIGPYKAQV